MAHTIGNTVVLKDGAAGDILDQTPTERWMETDAICVDATCTGRVFPPILSGVILHRSRGVYPGLAACVNHLLVKLPGCVPS